jgi:hypothetical protein
VTDRPDSPDDSESPEITEIRRLLADARHHEAMPDDVAARMDDVLAGLAPGHPVVTPLVRHRRRNLAGLLVAAAVVVAGVVVGPHLSLHSSSSSSGATTDSAGGSEPQANSRAAGKVPRASKGLLAQGTVAPRIREGRVVVRSRHFSTDALRARVQLTQGAEDLTTGATCADVPTGAGTVSAEYLHAPAALVFQPVKGASQVVDLYVCGDAIPVRSIALPAH